MRSEESPPWRTGSGMCSRWRWAAARAADSKSGGARIRLGLCGSNSSQRFQRLKITRRRILRNWRIRCAAEGAQKGRFLETFEKGSHRASMVLPCETVVASASVSVSSQRPPVRVIDRQPERPQSVAKSCGTRVSPTMPMADWGRFVCPCFVAAAALVARLAKGSAPVT
jgi:hypothetical protein